MAQTKPKAGQFYGVSNNGTDGEFLQTDGTGGMAWASPITNPTITSIDYPGSTTAADPAGGQSVIINGTLFASGITCTVGGTSAVTAFNSATQITITTPAKAAGPYTVAVLNPDGGTASENNFIQYSGVPVWSTAAGTLGNVLEGAAASFQVTATEGSDTIEYAVTTGTLPTGLSLATATGAITGTAPTVSADTTTTFSITATDDENQTSASRSFSITVQNDAPSNHFNTVLYTGNGSTTQAITGVGFEAGFTWTKCRSTTHQHGLFDIVRGANEWLHSDSTAAQTTYSGNFGLLSWASDGFTIGNGSYVNELNQTYVAWNFKAGGAAVANTDGTINSQVSANNSLGFSIATYTGNSTNGATIGHGLDSAPEMIIVKSLNTIGGSSKAWTVYVEPLGNTKNLYLNGTQAASVYNFWGNTSPTSSVLSLSSDTNVNSSVGNYVAYSFTSKPGMSKVGSYTGNGSASGPIVQTGFEPAFIMLKPTSIADNWMIYDNKRGDNKVLFPNLSNAESTYDGRLSFLANGFQITTTNSGWNSSGQTYIYLAIAADGSTATPSLANSFATEIYTGNAGASNTTSQSITSVGFKPDLTWIKNRDNANNNVLFDSIRGATNWLNSNNTNQTYSNSGTAGASFLSNGFTTGTSDQTNRNSNGIVAWSWKAGGTPSINTDGTITSVVSANQAAGFSVVKWTGNDLAGATIGHGLSSAPELYIIKKTSASLDWQINLASSVTGTAGYLNFNTAAMYTTFPNYYTSANSQVLSTNGTSTAERQYNNQSTDYIAYCFTSISGYSKVGSFVGNGSATGPVVTTGFQPNYLMWKASTSTGNWQIVDTARSPSANKRDQLYADLSQGADNTSYDIVDFNSNDFQMKQPYTNVSGVTYIYLAIKQN